VVKKKKKKVRSPSKCIKIQTALLVAKKAIILGTRFKMRTLKVQIQPSALESPEFNHGQREWSSTKGGGLGGPITQNEHANYTDSPGVPIWAGKQDEWGPSKGKGVKTPGVTIQHAIKPPTNMNRGWKKR